MAHAEATAKQVAPIRAMVTATAAVAAPVAEVARDIVPEAALTHAPIPARDCAHHLSSLFC